MSIKLHAMTMCIYILNAQFSVLFAMTKLQRCLNSSQTSSEIFTVIERLNMQEF